MPIKRDKDNKPMMDDEGRFLMVDAEGKDIDPIDPVTYAVDREEAATAANNESAARRRQLKDLQEKAQKSEKTLKALEEAVIEDLGEFISNSAQAIQQLEDVADKDKKWAIKVEDARREAREEVAKTKDEEIAKLQETVRTKDDIIHRKTVTAAFTGSPFIREKLIIPADVAEAYFGRFFKVDADSGELLVMDETGKERLFSRKQDRNSGEYADFEEGIQIHVMSHPSAKSLLVGQKGADADKSAEQAEKDKIEQQAIMYPSMEDKVKKTA